MRVAIIGNAGPGKSTLAQRLAKTQRLPVLDLDMVAWEPGEIAREREPGAAASDVHRFCGAADGWVVEGCYTNLVGLAPEYEPHLLFLDPGLDRCLAN